MWRLQCNKAYLDQYCKECVTMALIKGLLIFFVVLLGTSADQGTIDYIAQNLGIRYHVMDNLEGAAVYYDAELTFENLGSKTIPGQEEPWQLYFCHIRLMNLNGPVGLELTHVGGCLYKLEPAADFQDLTPGSELVVPIRGQNWMVATTDIMPNWYVTAEGLQPKLVSYTAGESLDFVDDFSTPEQWKRTNQDTYDPMTPQDRLNTRNYNDQGAPQKSVIPTPKEHSVDITKSQNIYSGDWVIIAMDPSVQPEAEFLADKLDLQVVSNIPEKHYISLAIGYEFSFPESYKVETINTQEIIEIRGSDRAAVFYGSQSLISLAYHDGTVPVGYIQDRPRFPYRGLQLDVSRNFHSKAEVLGLLEVMAMYKLNKLHLHLTDDEGWRLEIEGLPELTQVGASRCHDLSGDQCIMPQLGSTPDTSNPGSGYYTRADYREILTYATARHIQVIPEFDMPGHAHAAINAMLFRYRTYMDQSDPEEAEKYLLTDLNDTSEYMSVQLFTDNAMNPCVESMYTFIDHVMGAVVDLHVDIQPLEIFHFGGDEVPSTAWTESPACVNAGYQPSDSMSRSKLEQDFVARVASLASSYGMDIAGWEDVFYSLNNQGMHVPMDVTALNVSKVYTNPWNNVWEWGTGQRAYVMANMDYKVILSHATHLYFDHPYEPDPAERGFYWATRYTPCRKTFGYMPDSVYDNIDVDRMGEPLDKQKICTKHGCEPLDSDKTDNIIGIQGQLWSETVRTQAQLHYMLFPRVLALAERAWHKADWEGETDPDLRGEEQDRDYEDFANTLGYKELPRLDSMGIQYAINPAGASLDENSHVLTAKAEYPGLPVEYSDDDGQTWSTYEPGVIIDTDTIQVVVRSADGVRESRSILLKQAFTAGSPGVHNRHTSLLGMLLLVSVVFLYTSCFETFA